MREHLAYVAFVMMAAACGGNVGNGPCEGSDPDPTCAQLCGAANPCPTGFYCAADGTCNADCTGDGTGCATNEFCDPDGVCQPRVDADCPNVTLDTQRIIPTVQLLLDQSGSMTADFGGGQDRYEAMTSALVDSMNGVVTQLQGNVVFGASLYTSDNTGACPDITGVARSLNNLTAIEALLTGNAPSAETPTGDSIDVIVADFAANPVAADSVPIIVLATDGEPDTCEQPNPQEGQAEAIAAATAAFNAGIRLFIVGVSDDVGAPHLQDMANAGVGNDPVATGMQAPFFPADNVAELSTVLQQIIGGIVSCELTLDGSIDPAAAAQGTVTLNGTDLVEGVDWEVVDADSIRLIGGACDDLLGDPTASVTATFPCGVIVD